MNIIDFRKNHVLVDAYSSMNTLKCAFSDVDIAKRICKEIEEIKQKHIKDKYPIYLYVVNIELVKIVYYWSSNYDILLDIDNYLEQYKTNNFSLFYNIESYPQLKMQQLTDLYSVDNVIIAFKYRTKSQKADTYRYHVNKRILLKTKDVSSRDYKLTKLLDII